MKKRIISEFSESELRRIIRQEVEAIVSYYLQLRIDQIQTPEAASAQKELVGESEPSKLTYTVREVAELTGLSVPYIRLLIERKDLRVTRFGKRVFVLAEDLTTFLKRGAPPVRRSNLERTDDVFVRVPHVDKPVS